MASDNKGKEYPLKEVKIELTNGLAAEEKKEEDDDDGCIKKVKKVLSRSYRGGVDNGRRWCGGFPACGPGS